MVRMQAKGPDGENPTYKPAIRFLFGTEARTLTRDEWLAEPKPKYFDWVPGSEADPPATGENGNQGGDSENKESGPSNIL